AYAASSPPIVLVLDPSKEVEDEAEDDDEDDWGEEAAYPQRKAYEDEAAKGKIVNAYNKQICYIICMEPLFDHEKLDVYCVELGLITWITDFMDDASKSCAQHRRELIEQLDRASPANERLSVLPGPSAIDLVLRFGITRVPEVGISSVIKYRLLVGGR